MIISIILAIIAAYLVTGFLFAIPFIIKGVAQIDEGAQGATWGFRIIIIPGTIVFWPFLLKRLIRAAKTKEQ